MEPLIRAAMRTEHLSRVTQTKTTGRCGVWLAYTALSEVMCSSIDTDQNGDGMASYRSAPIELLHVHVKIAHVM